MIVGYSGADGTERAIEAQLRTRVLHEWAITVEWLSGRLDVDLKSGRGPGEVLALLSAISDAMAIEEAGRMVPGDLVGKIAELRQAAVTLLWEATKMIQHFLLVFDHRKGRLVEIQEFGTDSDAAVAAYAVKERELQDQRSMEIVLIGSDSIETVRLTHANYFDGTATLSKYLAGLGS